MLSTLHSCSHIQRLDSLLLCVSASLRLIVFSSSRKVNLILGWALSGGSALVLLASVSLAVVFLTKLTLSQPSARVQVLGDFESELDLNHWRGPIRLSTAHPSHGKNCVEVQFDSNSSSFSISPPDGNWS